MRNEFGRRMLELSLVVLLAAGAGSGSAQVRVSASGATLDGRAACSAPALTGWGATTTVQPSARPCFGDPPAGRQIDPLRRLREKAERLKRIVECAVDDHACIDRARKEGKTVRVAKPKGEPATGAPGSAGGAAEAPFEGELTATPLAPMPARPTGIETVVSDDGARAAGVAANGSRVVVVIDGKEGPPFDEIVPSAFAGGSDPPRGAAAFGPGGKRVAYVGVRSGAAIAVVDGEEGPPFTRIAASTLPGAPASGRTFYFSDDGSRVAYIGQTIEPGAQHGQSVQVVLDGQSGPKFAAVQDILFAGNRLAYVATRHDRKAVVVLDGKEMPAYDRVGHLRGNEEGHVAFVGTNGQNWTVVVDGANVGAHQRPAEEHDNRTLVLSPVGARVAYVSLARQRDGNDVDLYVDGKVVRTAAGVHSVIFSPDGRRLMASFTENKPSRNTTERVMVDDWTSLDYEGIPAEGSVTRGFPNMQFSPDGKRFAFLARNAHSSFVVVDGQESQGYSKIQNFRFSSDGRRYAFEAYDPPGGWVVVVDGKEGPKLYGLADGSLTFSPDGSRVAYAAALTPAVRDRVAVIDGQPQQVQPGTFEPRAPKDLASWQGRLRRIFVFSPDGRRLALIDRTSGSVRGAGALVIDGTRQASGHLFTPPIFSEDGRRFASAVWLNQRWHLVIDGKGTPIDGDLYEVPHALAFQKGGTVRILVVKGDMLYSVVAAPAGNP